MSNFRYRLLQFMQGRRGPDQFTEFLFAASGICIAFNILWRNGITGTLGIALCIYGMYRALSRNIHKREQENNWFLAMKYKFTGGRASGNPVFAVLKVREDTEAPAHLPDMADIQVPAEVALAVTGVKLPAMICRTMFILDVRPAARN